MRWQILQQICFEDLEYVAKDLLPKLLDANKYLSRAQDEDLELLLLGFKIGQFLIDPKFGFRIRYTQLFLGSKKKELKNLNKFLR